MRARNWCEALYDPDDPEKGNLRPDAGYYWHFAGDELKVGERKRKENVHELEIDPDVVPYLEEYLSVFRPLLPGSEKHHYLFPRVKRGKGGPKSPIMTVKGLYTRLKVHLYRHTEKRAYTHLFRTIFMTNMLDANTDINTIALYMNDLPQTVWKYNEARQGRSSIDSAFKKEYARARRRMW